MIATTEDVDANNHCPSEVPSTSLPSVELTLLKPSKGELSSSPLSEEFPSKDPIPPPNQTNGVCDANNSSEDPTESHSLSHPHSTETSSTSHQVTPNHRIQAIRKESSVCSTTSSNSGSCCMSEPVSSSFPRHRVSLNGQDDDAISLASESISNMDDHEAYTSKLTEEQPLYQHFAFQDPEKTADEDILGQQSSSVDPSPPEFEQNMAKNIHLEVSGDKLGLEKQNEESSKLQQPKKAIMGLPSTSLVCQEGEESDSICCDESAEFPDDPTIISVRRQSSNASASTDSGRGPDVSLLSNPSMRRERLTAASVYGSQRSLWCELPEVREAGLLDSLSNDDKKLQEAYFEVITSEASYLRSINFLISHFMGAEEFSGDKKNPRAIITSSDRKRLFSNILAIRDCSEQLLSRLETRLKESLVLLDVCDILCEFFEKHFDPYVKYCSNQVYQERQLSKLKAMNPQFLTVLRRIESDRNCHGLDMRSFLVLPAQRITRYRLLVYAILSRISDTQSPQHSIATRAYNLASLVVQNCNESARRMERIEQLAEIEGKLTYKNSELKKVPLVNPARYVVKSGPLIQIVEQKTKTKLNMLQSGNRVKARPLFLFLFSDLLLIAKKKVNGTFVCKDYAQRRFVVTQPVEIHNQRVPLGTVSALVNSKASRTPHLFICVLMQNSRRRQVELLLNCESESERERWLSSMRPPTCTNPGEKVYAKWDCPQAVVLHDYEARQEDELHLKNGELVDILRKMDDGWYFGEVTSKDGILRSGWFPSSYVQQIMNDHVRANKYRERLEMIQRAERLAEVKQTSKNDSNSRSSSVGLYGSTVLPSIPPQNPGIGGLHSECPPPLSARLPQHRQHDKLINSFRRLSTMGSSFQ